jgi:hypothetical protein
VTTAYTSTVVARGHAVAGGVLGLVALALPAVGVPWPVAVAAAVLLVVTGVRLGTVRLAIGETEVRVTAGLSGRARRIPRARVRTATAVSLSRAQTLGLGLPLRTRTTRLTVRPGPTLVVALDDGEVLRISTAEPARAADRLIVTTKESP